ncbi:hypothetical protein [Micromonospora humi]|uniref:hypothetical protein n=1 Tax=Micromonospora humi TaxID=745366 RepID=UPI000B86F905|nr:hypothetical protein [Micromonospora humi]
MHRGPCLVRRVRHYHHGHADIGSAAFSSDGKLLWAHVRNRPGHDVEEEWLILDPADGAVLTRADTMTVGSSSLHFPHPNPAYMGLTVAEGEENSPVLWATGTARTSPSSGSSRRSSSP